MIVIFAPTATAELDGIWRWNAERYSVAHADFYIKHLRNRIGNLAVLYKQGKTVSVRPDLHYIIIRRGTKGHGHIAVYRIAEKTVDVLHVFHTAQDWQATLGRESHPQ